MSGTIRTRLVTVVVTAVATLLLSAAAAAAAPAPPPPPTPVGKPGGPPEVAGGAGLQAGAIAGYEIVRTGPHVVPARVSGLRNATCPAGTRILGGGEYNDGGDAVTKLTKSLPVSTGGTDRWVAEVANTGDVDHTVWVFAICGSGLTSHQIPQQYRGPSGDPNQRFVTVSCAAPAQALGGGIDASGEVTITKIGAYPPHERYVSFWPRDAELAARGYAVCVTGLTAHQVVTGHTGLPGYGYGYADASCPAGMAVLGGGGGTDHYGIVTDSYPISSTQWRVYGKNTSTSGLSLHVWAVCGS